jgi:hypothetical protein
MLNPPPCGRSSYVRWRQSLVVLLTDSPSWTEERRRARHPFIIAMRRTKPRRRANLPLRVLPPATRRQTASKLFSSLKYSFLYERATSWTAEVLGFSSRQGKATRLFFTASRPAPRPKRPRIQSVPCAPYTGVNWLLRSIQRRSQECCKYTSSICRHGLVVN